MSCTHTGLHSCARRVKMLSDGLAARARSKGQAGPGGGQNMWWDKIPRLTPQIYSNPVKPSPARTKWENPATDAVTRQPGADPHKPGQTYLGRSVVLHGELTDRKSTRLNSSHLVISYAVF